jgi:hypothetical protein
MLAGMADRRPARWMRNADATLLMESFFIAAVVSFLAIRAVLALTGYPRLGANGIHVAHNVAAGLPRGQAPAASGFPLSAAAIPRAHARTSSHERKSPSGTRSAVRITFSPRPSTDRSTLPANKR